MYTNPHPRIITTIQARIGSSRLPGKVLSPLAGEPALKRMIDRIQQCHFVDEIVVATTVNPLDNEIVEFCKHYNYSYYRGSEEDVLDRILKASQHYQAEAQIALTADCPLIDPTHIDEVAKTFLEGNYDYVSNAAIERSYPDGFDVQIFPVSVLEEVDKLTSDYTDRIHGTYYVYQHPEQFKLKSLRAKGKMVWPELGVTLDEEADYYLLNAIFECLLPIDPYFSAEMVVDLLRANPGLLEINHQVRRKKPQEG